MMPSFIKKFLCKHLWILDSDTKLSDKDGDWKYHCYFCNVTKIQKGKYLYFDRICSDCGKRMRACIDRKTKKIISRDTYFFGTLKLGVGMWSAYRIITKEDGSLGFKRCIPLWKYWFNRLRDLKRLIFREYDEIEYWECKKCYERGNKKGIANTWISKARKWERKKNGSSK